VFPAGTLSGESLALVPSFPLYAPRHCGVHIGSPFSYDDPALQFFLFFLSPLKDPFGRKVIEQDSGSTSRSRRCLSSFVAEGEKLFLLFFSSIGEVRRALLLPCPWFCESSDHPPLLFFRLLHFFSSPLLCFLEIFSLVWRHTFRDFCVSVYATTIFSLSLILFISLLNSSFTEYCALALSLPDFFNRMRSSHPPRAMVPLTFSPPLMEGKESYGLRPFAFLAQGLIQRTSFFRYPSALDPCWSSRVWVKSIVVIFPPSVGLLEATTPSPFDPFFDPAALHHCHLFCDPYCRSAFPPSLFPHPCYLR